MNIWVKSCVIAFIGLPALAFGDDCGKPPPQNTDFSSDFHKAILVITSASNQSSTSANVTVPIDDVPVAFGFKHDDQGKQDASSSMTISNAVHLIQREYSNKSAQILDICGYRMCTMLQNPGGAISSGALANVCNIAINGSDYSPISTTALQVQPSVMPYIFEEGQTSAKATLTVTNSAPGPIVLKLPEPTDFISIESSHHVTIPHDGSAQILLKLKRPMLSTGVVQQTLTFLAESDFHATASASVDLIPDKALLYPPAAIPCGRINPNATAMAFSDRKRGEGFDPKQSNDIGWRDVATGDADAAGHAGAEYHNNGGGDADALVGTSCTQLEATQTDALTTITIHPHLKATSGHCCGGFGPGGQAAANPEWKEEIILPGDVTRHHWTLSLSTNVSSEFPSRSCVFSVDNANEFAVPTRGSVVKNFQLVPGKHSLDLHCVSASDWASRPGAWDHHAEADEVEGLSLHAARSNTPAGPLR